MDTVYLKKVTEGNANAFRYFVEKYKDKAFSVAFSIVRDNIQADDIVQEAFINAFRKINSYRGESCFSTWLMRIVVNESIKVIRKKKIQIDGLKDYGKEVSEFEVNQSLLSIKLNDQKKYIDLVLEKLPRREALVLQLFYISEYSLLEMEEIMDLKADHIKVILFRARKQFYKLLQDELKHELTSII